MSSSFVQVCPGSTGGNDPGMFTLTARLHRVRWYSRAGCYGAVSEDIRNPRTSIPTRTCRPSASASQDSNFGGTPHGLTPSDPRMHLGYRNKDAATSRLRE